MRLQTAMVALASEAGMMFEPPDAKLTDNESFCCGRDEMYRQWIHCITPTLDGAGLNADIQLPPRDTIGGRRGNHASHFTEQTRRDDRGNRNRCHRIMVTHQDILAVLELVPDPELPVSIVQLGLVEDVRFVDNTAHIVLLPTWSGCPALPMIEADVRDRVSALDGVDVCEIQWHYEPAWTPDRISPDGLAKNQTARRNNAIGLLQQQRAVDPSRSPPRCCHAPTAAHAKHDSTAPTAQPAAEPSTSAMGAETNSSI